LRGEIRFGGDSSEEVLCIFLGVLRIFWGDVSEMGMFSLCRVVLLGELLWLIICFLDGLLRRVTKETKRFAI